MKILENKDYIEIRKKIIDKFLDYSSESLREQYYEDRILKTVDGLFYTGYFWDILKNPTIIEEEEAISFLNKYSKNFYILWDNNIFSYKELKKYPIFSVLKISMKEFECIRSKLPSDIYLCDENFDWFISITHEYIGEKRYCVFVK